MILYLSSNENKDILDYIIEDKKLVVKKLIGEFDINKFVLHDMRNLSLCTQIVIDLRAVTDKEEELINALIAFKTIYDARVIILAECLKCGNELLKRLIDVGVYNIIISEDIENIHKEIEKCIMGEGMTYQDCLKLITKPIDIQDKVISNLKRENVKIAVAGVMHRIGTTTTAINLANYLASIGAKVCYVENNKSGHLKMLSKFYKELINKNNYLEYKGVKYYENNQNIESDNDFIIYDMGEITYKNTVAFSNDTVNILCAGIKPYELKMLYKISKLILDIDVQIVLSFVSNRDKNKTEKLLSELNNRYYYVKNSTDLFSCNCNEEVFNQLLREYIKIQ
ncbi:hypothetical protein SH1V18_38440 [Vallitalea longa]|uniref:Uncharacterized protein n=1 Tax=Vallitalea longa TaxID=2936439 RepID=A0A9W5YE36_9FIRM|nr:hypothetical protein [Vallitalea longa]GKX31364.1 hypothetical protein SH1V18_38440 [Vallitalea longa]